MKTMVKQKNKKKWLRFRHRWVRQVAYAILRPYIRLTYGLKPEPFKEQGDRAYLILMNHQTAFDQFFVGMAFKGPVYYVASEDLFSNGWVSSLIRWLVAPIPIRKQTTDITAVMTCIRVAREGGTIAIAPEGNRTYSGKTQYMNDAIAGLAKKLKLPIALFRIEGGYGVQPRWSDKNRRGKMRAYVSRVIEPEEAAAMTHEELFAAVQKELYVNEAVADGPFKSAKKAEYLERAIYVCPKCGLSEFESHGDRLTCKKCGLTATYGEDKTLTGEGLPFRFVNGWYEYQEEFINGLDVLQYCRKPMYRDGARLSEVIVYKRKEMLRKWANISLYGDRIVIDEGQENALALPFDQVNAVTVLGRNKLNIYHGDRIYQLKGGKRFNALKYVHIFHRHKNIIKGDKHGKFLGI